MWALPIAILFWLWWMQENNRIREEEARNRVYRFNRSLDDAAYAREKTKERKLRSVGKRRRSSNH